MTLHSGHLAPPAGLGKHGAMAEEMAIYRGEALSIMRALMDIRSEVRELRRLIEEEDGEEEEEQEGDS